MKFMSFMTTKIFITGLEKIDKLVFAKAIVVIDDDLSISQRFTNDIEYKDSPYDEYIFYLDSADVDISYKNNAFLFITASDMLYTGITLDSFYNEDVFCMNICEFNNVPDYIFEINDILVVWLDTKIQMKDKDNLDEIMGIKHFVEKIEKLNVLYFLDETPEKVAQVVLEYLESDAEGKERILEENY